MKAARKTKAFEALVSTVEKPAIMANLGVMEPQAHENPEAAAEGGMGSEGAKSPTSSPNAKLWFEIAKLKEGWEELRSHNDPRIRLAALKYLTDRQYGRAASAAKTSGEKQHKITLVVDL